MLNQPIKDPITRPPDFTGNHSKAWAVDLESARKVAEIPEDDAGIGLWLVEAPWAHPVWHSYAITLVHLRPLPDDRPLHIHLQGATHEILVFALDPDGDRHKMLADGRPPCLVPCNFGAQFIMPNDAEALKYVEETIQFICDGTLSPDTDFLRDWVARFNASMVKVGWV